MFSSKTLGACLLALCSSALAASIPGLEARDGYCSNGPQSRQCCQDGFNVETDYDRKWPVTGKTVHYDLEITKMTLAPDGFPREMLVFNGQYPGPTIEADWGDEIEVTIKNSIPGMNGTSVHWHGIHQRGTNQMDGAAGVTECPIAPGTSRTYKFRATTHGTTWYHAHLTLQYSDGLVGPIVIRGPATANYDIDLGPLSITDWFHKPGFESVDAILHANAPPVSDSILINGLAQVGGAGQLSKTVLTPGKKHRLRIISTAVNNYLQVSLDNHQFTVITADFTPIVPYTTNKLILAAGQRYDVIITANQPVGNYAFRVGTGSGAFAPSPTICDGPNRGAQSGLAVFSYKGVSHAVLPPNSTASAFDYGTCHDESGIVPYIKTTVPQGIGKTFDLAFKAFNATTGQTVMWFINNSAIDLEWDRPTLLSLTEGVSEFPRDDNLYHIGNDGGWTYWIIQQDLSGAQIPPLAHPIHLHGHDFWVLGSGRGAFGGAYGSLQFENPVRRDTATLPPGGWLIVAFPAINPGAWVMHCHIPFHMSQGFGLQFLESEEQLRQQDFGLLQDGCRAWNSAIEEPDSGL